MKNAFKRHPFIFTFFIVLYCVAMWAAYNIFGNMGLTYVVLVPLPIIIFSLLVQKNKGAARKSSQMPSIWSTPVPYLGIILLGSVLVFAASKFI